MEKERVLFDVNPLCGFDAQCPKFVLDEQKQIVSLVDKQGSRASMTVQEFNKFVQAVKSGDLAELKPLIRK